jgi:thioredoxin 1
MFDATPLIPAYSFVSWTTFVDVSARGSVLVCTYGPTKEESVAIPTLSSEAFKQEIEARKGRVVADFYADWCGPCHQVAPLIEELSSKYGDTVRFVKVDIDESPDLAREYGVFSIPTIVLFERGETKSRVTGARPAHVIERKLELTPSHRGGDHLHWSA